MVGGLAVCYDICGYCGILVCWLVVNISTFFGVVYDKCFIGMMGSVVADWGIGVCCLGQRCADNGLICGSCWVVLGVGVADWGWCI